MTNGASQGLFVIVAVVIFGIFVLISYMLFRDKLKTGLADIFDDSISQTTYNLKISDNLIKDSNLYTITNKNVGDWMFSNLSTYKVLDSFEGEDNVIEISQNTQDSSSKWAYLAQQISQEDSYFKKGDILKFKTRIYIPKNIPLPSELDQTRGVSFGYYKNINGDWYHGQLSAITKRGSWMDVEQSITITEDKPKNVILTVGISNLDNSSEKNYKFYITSFEVYKINKN